MLKKSYEPKNAINGGRVNSSQFGGDIFYECPFCGGHRYDHWAISYLFKDSNARISPLFFCDIDHILQTPFGLIENFEF